MKLPILVATLLGLSFGAGAASAQQKVLTVVPNLCPQAIEMLSKWGSLTTTNAAMAVPRDPNFEGCDDPTFQPLTAGIAFGAVTMEAATEAALATCEANRTAGLGRCFVIGKLSLQ